MSPKITSPGKAERLVTLRKRGLETKLDVQLERAKINLVDERPRSQCIGFVLANQIIYEVEK